MHELGLAQSLLEYLEKAAQEHHLKNIKSVTLKIGKMRQIVPETLQFLFQTLAEGTIADQANLIIDVLPVRVYCAHCDRQFTLQHHKYVCPTCGNTSLKWISGKEIIIDHMTGDSVDAS